jgi:hypothetical protein
MIRHAALILLLFLPLIPAQAERRTQHPEDLVVDYKLFADPPKEYRGHRWLTLRLANVTEESLRATIKQLAESDTGGGLMITPDGGNTSALSDDYMKGSHRQPNTTGVAYLSEEYFRLYRAAIEEANKDGLPLRVLYDELQYPSGMAGGLLYTKYPEAAAKSLEMIEKNAAGPTRVQLDIPIANGIYVGAVMMNRDTNERVEVAGNRTTNFQIPSGNWKAMLFYLDPAFRPQSTKGGFVDYLDPGAVDKYIHLNFDPYYAHLKEFFGNPIQMTFYDEPAMHLSDGRMWTASFVAAFTKQYGYSPMKYFPALWYDIGPETAAARNALFGFRARMYAENYIGRVAAWCAAHGIDMSGHQDQEEARNPVGIHGDLMKTFEHQQIPGVDDIYTTGRSNVGYKVVTSSAFNWDKPLVMAETYAAYRQMTPAKAYKTAMDQFAMGVNLQIGNRPPEIGPQLDHFVGRMSYLLRHGRHVADIAVLYPIASLQAAYYFATPPASNRPGSSAAFYWPLEGGVVPPDIHYMDLGEMLYRGLRIDYTYLHPEVLTGRTLINDHKLVIDNKENREEFHVLILPGGDALAADAAKKILEFYRGGGTVIALHDLPSKSAEFHRDREVQDMVGEVFGFPKNDPVSAEIRIVVDSFKSYFTKHNDAGGHSYFLPQPDIKLVQTVLKEAIPTWDVDIQQPPLWPVKLYPDYDGALTYIHKIKDGKDIYFFANSQDTPVDTKVVLRGKKTLWLWNPHSGERQRAEATQSETNGQPLTTVQLTLAPVHATFMVSE